MDRSRTREFEDWRYRDCPAMEAAIAMVHGKCVATMFALRRRYQTPDGRREWLEPFEWHASEEWRAQAPGLRLVRHFMKGPTPLITVAGTDVATGLLERLKWSHIGFANRYVLPLTGRFLMSRGRGAFLSYAFDIIGHQRFAPKRMRDSELTLEPANSFAPALSDIVSRQRRFALMRMPDQTVSRWLQSAPAVVGHYLTLHARVRDELVGWVTGRIFSRGSLRIGELLEVFLDDERRSLYPALIAEAGSILAGFGTDALLCTTTCPDTTAALIAMKFRPDDSRPVFIFWRNGPSLERRPLVDGAIADHAFFPVPSARDSLWLDGKALAAR